NLRLQYVAAGNRQIGRRFARLGLLDHFSDRKGLALRSADADNAIHVHTLPRHLFHGDDISVAVEFLGCIYHLRKAAAAVLNEHVWQKYGEWLVSDQFALAPDRVPKAERRLLAGKAHGSGLRQIF